MARDALIELRGVTRRFLTGPSTIEALVGVTLTIERGECVALTGPSGSGKSTLMHILGFLDRPTAGIYRFDKHDVTRVTDAGLVNRRRFSVGFVFQQFHLLPRLSALENVEVALMYQRVSRPERIRRSLEALRQVGLEERKRHRPNELSGGEQQRVAFARAIVKNAPLILADEPTGNLDSQSGAEILALLRACNREGRTVVVVTHDEGIANSLPRRVRLKDGRIVE